MKITINSPGTYISKNGDCFQISYNDRKEEVSVKKVEQIMITTAAAISTDAILLAVENNIDIVFLKYNGEPYGRVWHSKLGSVSTIRRKQLMLQDSKFGLDLVKEWIGQKLQNQKDFLKNLLMNRRDEERQSIIRDAIGKVQELQEKVKKLNASDIDEARYSLQGFEGSAGRVYFQTLGQLMPEKYKFEGRSRNPAKDAFNCMLNYSYGILYSKVEKACIIAGLDPYIGIMHTDNYNRQALVYDIVELYRGYMDEIVFKLFTGKKIKEEYFNPVEGGVYLNEDGKKVLIEAVNKAMSGKIKYKGKNIELQNIMQYDCHRIANQILKEA